MVHSKSSPPSRAKPPGASTNKQISAREERLCEALRDNLRRRKTAAKERHQAQEPQQTSQSPEGNPSGKGA